jgi:hypothetical protein
MTPCGSRYGQMSRDGCRQVPGRARLRRQRQLAARTARVQGGLQGRGDRPNWTPRELRHSFVSLMSSTGVPVEEICPARGPLKYQDDRGGLQARATAGPDDRGRSHGQAIQSRHIPLSAYPRRRGVQAVPGGIRAAMARSSRPRPHLHVLQESIDKISAVTRWPDHRMRLRYRTSGLAHLDDNGTKVASMPGTAASSPTDAGHHIR